MEDIVIVGAGGFGREVAWLIEEINENEVKWNILGFIDDNEFIQGEFINGYKVIGTTDSLINQNVNVVIAISNPKMRETIIKKIKKTTNNFPTLIHPSTNISNLVRIGKGVIIAAGSIITVNINIGDFVIIDRGCNVGHDTIIDSFSTLLPGTVLSGNVKINNYVMIGSRTIVIQGLTIGENSLIGAGAVVTKNIPINCTAVGVPAKPIKFHNN